jgi:hypothetical protein
MTMAYTPRGSRKSIRLGSENELLCPLCGFEYTHVEIAYISARGEDQVPNEIGVNAVTGRVETQMPYTPPAGSDGEGRRHRIALAGSCENGCEFAIVFTQHKGSTYIEAVPRSAVTDEAGPLADGTMIARARP